MYSYTFGDRYIIKFRFVFTANKPEHAEKHVQNIVINFGPQHPAAHGVLRLVLTLDGEVGITDCPVIKL